MAMPLEERKTRHAALYAALLRNDLAKWGDRFLAALDAEKAAPQGKRPQTQAFEEFLSPPR